MLVYNEYDWSDITPIAQDEGPNPVATINYDPEYAKASGLLRALMAKNEISERALAVATEIIEFNPAHYTVWEYRLRIIKEIGSQVIAKQDWLIQTEPPVCDDGDWLNSTTLDNTKNYQIWHYRQCLVVENPSFYRGELVLIKSALEEDSKNYHAWSHFIWLIKGRLDIFPLSEQIEYVNRLIDEDVRNNSAWNAKFFLYSLVEELESEEVFDAEQQFVLAKIALAPQNESPWNYLAGLHDKYKGNRLGLEQTCLQYTEPEVKSTHALEILQGIYSTTAPSKSIDILDILEDYIPTRKGYWSYLRQQVSVSGS